MPSFMKFAAAALAVATPLVSAQTYSECNPMKATCPANKGSTESNLHFDFTLSLIHISEPTRRTPISYAVFCLKKKSMPSSA